MLALAATGTTLAPTTRGFAPIDWAIVGVYLIVVVMIGTVVSRRAEDGTTLLAGRSMPVWAVALSVLATSLSAATFIGGPQQAYATDLTYFTAGIGGLLAALIVAGLFVPAYYRLGVTSVYELLGHSHGPAARRAASATFMLGRVFASGARLFMVALPFALVAFGNTRPASLLASIVIITVAATVYTAAGGIRAVIWTDVLQAVLVVVTVGAALFVLRSRIPLEADEIVHTLGNAPGGSKLRALDFSFDLTRPFTVWTTLTGLVLFNLAAFGTDQDLTQRMLTCRSARGGAWSVIIANLLGWPIVLLFLGLGLLLHVYYQRPDVMGAAAPGYTIDDSRRVFLEFILAEMPTGMRGLMIAGLFAASMSSLDSALNAMAATSIADFYRPWRRRRSGGAPDDPRRERRASRLAMVGWAVTLAGFAAVCVYWQRASGQTLIAFALRVMVFAYGGLLGVFLAALLTRRGNAVSAVAALIAGFLTVLALQDFCWRWWTPRLGVDSPPLAFPWHMVIATAISFVLCCLGRRPPSRGTAE